MLSPHPCKIRLGSDPRGGHGGEGVSPGDLIPVAGSGSLGMGVVWPSAMLLRRVSSPSSPVLSLFTTYIGWG